MNDPNWPELLTGLMDRANDQLRNGDRQAAASDMARASELLFLQAKGASNLEEKQRFVKRAGQLLEASLTLSNTGQKNHVSPKQDDAVSVEIMSCMGLTLGSMHIVKKGICSRFPFSVSLKN